MSASLLQRLIEAGTPVELIAEVAELMGDVRSLSVKRAADRDRTAQYRKRRNISDNEWAALTRLVVERDGWVCTYCDCDTSLPENGHAIDHVHPLARGGTNDIDNLTMACRACNSSKSDRLVDEEWTPPNDDFERWKAPTQ